MKQYRWRDMQVRLMCKALWVHIQFMHQFHSPDVCHRCIHQAGDEARQDQSSKEGAVLSPSGQWNCENWSDRCWICKYFSKFRQTQAVKEDVGSAEHFEYDGELRHACFVWQAARDLIGTVWTKDPGGGTSKEDDGCAGHPEHDAQIWDKQFVRNEFSWDAVKPKVGNACSYSWLRIKCASVQPNNGVGMWVARIGFVEGGWRVGNSKRRVDTMPRWEKYCCAHCWRCTARIRVAMRQCIQTTSECQSLVEIRPCRMFQIWDQMATSMW